MAAASKKAQITVITAWRYRTRELKLKTTVLRESAAKQYGQDVTHEKRITSKKESVSTGETPPMTFRLLCASLARANNEVVRRTNDFGADHVARHRKR